MPQHIHRSDGLRTGRPAAMHRALLAALGASTALAAAACSGTPATPGATPPAIRGTSVTTVAAAGPADACALVPAADLAALGIRTPGTPADLGASPDHTVTCVWPPESPSAPALSLTVTVPQDDAGRQRAAAEKLQATAHPGSLVPVAGVGDAALLSRSTAGLTVLQFWHGTTQATLSCTNAGAGLLPALTATAAHVAARL